MLASHCYFWVPSNISRLFLGYQRGYKIFCIHCLTFGLSSATFVYTKVVRPSVKHWRLHAVKIACFLDDGLGIAYTYQDALSYSNFVKSTLINSGFVPNATRSVWIPCQRIIWLGIEIDININTLWITSSRITTILNKIEFLTTKENYKILQLVIPQILIIKIL